MRNYVVCSRHLDDPMGERLSRALRVRASAAGFRIRDLSPLVWLADSVAFPIPLRRREPWALVGDVFERDPPPTVDSTPWGRVWGRYVALEIDARGGLSAVFRDPSGALDAIVWSAHGLTFAASDPPDWLVAGVRPPWRIRHDRLAAVLADPVLAGADLLLEGPVAVLPGARMSLPGGVSTMVWRPADFARQASTVRRSDHAAAQALRRTVEDTVAAMAQVAGPAAAEISGGFDSSVVAACLSRVAGADVRLWLNAFGPDPAADERPFVEALGSRLSIQPVFAQRRDTPLTPAWLERMPQGVRPSLAALDGPHDADWADRLAAVGACTLFTGKGGDALFVQPMTSAVFTDLWRDRGLSAALSPALPAIARRSERSVWTLLRDALSDRTVRAPPDAAPADLYTSPLPPQRHPWLDGTEDLGPAKRYQILGLAHGLTVYGRSLKTKVVDPVHPLLSQPVVELCLSLPAYQLTLARRDRALARLAFADRLPPVIVERRSKGELSGYFGRMVADGLDAVRPWLLEGRLAAEGHIDRAAFERLLHRDVLAWRGGSVEVLTAVAFEGWVRAWEGRLGSPGGRS